MANSEKQQPSYQSLSEIINLKLHCLISCGGHASQEERMIRKIQTCVSVDFSAEGYLTERQCEDLASWLPCCDQLCTLRFGVENFVGPAAAAHLLRGLGARDTPLDLEVAPCFRYTRGTLFLEESCAGADWLPAALRLGHLRRVVAARLSGLEACGELVASVLSVVQGSNEKKRVMDLDLSTVAEPHLLVFESGELALSGACAQAEWLSACWSLPGLRGVTCASPAQRDLAAEHLLQVCEQFSFPPFKIFFGGKEYDPMEEDLQGRGLGDADLPWLLRRLEAQHSINLSNNVFSHAGRGQLAGCPHGRVVLEPAAGLQPVQGLNVCEVLDLTAEPALTDEQCRQVLGVLSARSSLSVKGQVTPLVDSVITQGLGAADQQRPGAARSRSPASKIKAGTSAGAGGPRLVRSSSKCSSITSGSTSEGNSTTSENSTTSASSGTTAGRSPCRSGSKTNNPSRSNSKTNNPSRTCSKTNNPSRSDSKASSPCRSGSKTSASNAALRLANRCKPGGGRFILRAYREGKKIVNLFAMDLSEQGLTDEDVPWIALRLRVETETLNLAGNDFSPAARARLLRLPGPAGAEAAFTMELASGLKPVKHLPAVQKLVFASNCFNGRPLGHEGAAAIAPVLRELRLVDTLELRDNALGPSGVAALVPALRELKQLRHLGLGSNAIGNDGAQALAPALRELSCLQRLGLDFNGMGRAGAEALAPALSKLRKLENLWLFGNFGKEAVAALGPTLDRLKEQGCECSI